MKFSNLIERVLLAVIIIFQYYYGETELYTCWNGLHAEKMNEKDDMDTNGYNGTRIYSCWCSRKLIQTMWIVEYLFDSNWVDLSSVWSLKIKKEKGHDISKLVSVLL